jgi:hypothetical protein
MEIEMKAIVENAKHWSFFLMAVAVVTGLLGVAACDKRESSVKAATTEQTTFSNPSEAGQALQQAARTNDENALSRILGPAAKDVLNSGDPVEDKAALDSFVNKYDRMNRWVAMTDGSQLLNIGADNYPFPIPLAQNASSKWYFHTAAGADEILARRIGRNELLAIDAVSAIANAQELYFRKAHDDNPKHLYTALIISHAGKQDGLYWSVPQDQQDDQKSSPLGRLSDFARNDSTTDPTTPQMFDGYYFRILTAQGDQAKDGAKSYLVNGKLTAGFAVIASPVTYRDSGIMTFIMSREGVVYQRDLGPNTAAVAASTTQYNPAGEWTPVE